MNISFYICSLLYRHDCVIVPAFGGFVTKNTSAKLNQNTHEITPPAKQISFNSQVKNNDGLLANFIAAYDNISYDTALAKIQEQVSKWDYALAKNETVTIEHIGTLVLNQERNITFTADKTINFLTSSFGLDKVNSKLVSREVFTTQNVETPIIPLVAETEENQSATLVVAKKTNTGFTLLKYAAAAILFVGIGTTAYQQYLNFEFEKQTLIVEKKVQEQVQQKIQQATFFIDLPSPAAEVEVIEKRYHIVAGAFRNEKNAIKKRKALVKQGFESRILEQNKFGLYPVIYNSFTSAEEALQSKKVIQKERNAEAWLLID